MGWEGDVLNSFLKGHQISSDSFEKETARKAAKEQALEQFLRGQQATAEDRKYNEGLESTRYARNLADKKVSEKEYRDWKSKEDQKNRETDLEKARLSGKGAKGTGGTLQDRIAGLKSYDKGRYMYFSEGLKEINKMISHLDKGGGRAKIGGDNDFTLAATKLFNALARPETGAAIPSHERQDYMSQITGGWDSPGMQRKKLQELRDRLSSFVSATGIEPTEIPGYAPIDFTSDTPSRTEGLYRDYVKPVGGFVQELFKSSPATPSLETLSDEELIKRSGGL